MPSALLLASLLAQASNGQVLPQAPLAIPRRRPVTAAPPPVAPPPVASRFTRCRELARSAPLEAIEVAQGWHDAETGSAAGQPGECLGLALSALERFDEAEAAFIAARDVTPANEPVTRARRGAMAGNAALARGALPTALQALNGAASDAAISGEALLVGEIAIDRARVLVALGRLPEAATALEAARKSAPANGQAWLLSATLARRQNQLAEAQRFIEQSAALDPRDPETGVEAGVIAMLSGREATARKSWTSVIAAAPGSDQARRAKGYLDQLPPARAPSRSQ